MLHNIVLLLVTDVSEQPIGSYLQGSWVLPLKTVPIECPKTSVTNYQYTPRNITEEQRSHVHLSESPKLSKEGDLHRLVMNKKPGLFPFILKL